MIAPESIARHALIRSLMLILLAVFLSTPGYLRDQLRFVNCWPKSAWGTWWSFSAGARRACPALGPRDHPGRLWLLFYLYPLPGRTSNYEALGLSSDWPNLTGLAAHWNKNTNVAADFDRWFLNLFPRDLTFQFNQGGYQTLNFIPSLATMTFGLMAGEMLRGPRSRPPKLRWLITAGILCLLIGILMDHLIWPDWLANLMAELGARLIFPLHHFLIALGRSVRLSSASGRRAGPSSAPAGRS